MDLGGGLPLSAEDEAFLVRMERLQASHPHNLAARHVSRGLLASLSVVQRRELRACCRSGAENPDSIVGCYLLEPGGLHGLDAFFGPLIRAHHGVGEGEAPAAGKAASLDLSNVALPVLSTRVRVGRNLEGFPLPARMDRADRVRLERSMVRALQVLINDPRHGGRVFSLTPDLGDGEPNQNLIGDGEYRALVEAHVMFADMEADRFMTSAGLAADWPYGRACYVSDDRCVIVWIGEEDHLRVISMSPGAALPDAYDRLQAVLAIIESLPGVSFVRDSDYGFVTSCPSNLGTGLRASVRVVLPWLTQPGVDARAVCRRFGLAASGVAGDRSALGGDGRVDLSPIRRLFLPDRDILANLVRGLGQLTEAGPRIASSCVNGVSA